MTKLKLIFLGPPYLELGGQIVEPDTRKAVALLAYLAISGERLSRDALAAFLWPEFDDRRSKAALRRTLSALKSTIGDAPLYATREHIGVEEEQFWCDVLNFQQAINSTKTDNHQTEPLCLTCQRQLEMAVDLYRDEFMSGFSLRDSIPFDDWQIQQAENLRLELVFALEQLLHGAIDRHDFESGIVYGRRWLQIDPLREEAHCQLMRLYTWSGQRSAALVQYRDCVRILDDELGVPPLPETTALYNDIQRDILAKPPLRVSRVEAELSGDRHEAITPVSTLTSMAPTVSPFVGRQAELDSMWQLYRQVGPDGRLLIIEGEPGIGKTRLAQSLLEKAAVNGAVILTAHCYEGETNLAYAPIIQILRDGLESVDDSLLDSLPGHHVVETARLLPQLADGRSLPPLPTLNAPGAQVRFFEGIIHFLTALLSRSSPGILWLDDAHWLDSASRDLLLYLLHRWQKRPFLILLCWQAEELSLDNPLLPLAANLRRAGVCQTIRLSRFTSCEVDELLTTTGINYQSDLSSRLFNETEGLPFFVMEYLNAMAGWETEPVDDKSLQTPASVRDLLHNRLAQVSETERQILQAGAAIGHSFNMELVQTASGRSLDEAVAALERLVGRGLLVEKMAVYDFNHDKLRAVVYDEMGLARRRLLHRRLAESLANRLQLPTAAVSAQIANHFQLAGQEAEAAAYFVQAGDQARSLYAHQEAIHYYRSALALGALDPWRLHAACGEMSMRLGIYPDALSSYETAAALAPDSELGRLEHQLARVYQRTGNWLLAANMLAQAQQHLGDNASPAIMADLVIDRSFVAYRRKLPDEALAQAQKALSLAEKAADGLMLALSYNILGMLARGRGELETAVSYLEQSRRLADDSHRLDIQIAARNNLALTYNANGQTALARTHLEEALALCVQFGDLHQEAALRSNLADVLHQAGEESTAQEQIRQSVTIYAEIGRQADEWQAEIWKLVEW